MRRNGLLLPTFISAFFLLASCGGGGGGGAPSGPFLAWAKFRRNNNNSGLASSTLNSNDGVASLVFRLPSTMEATVSTPALGGDDIIYLGTSNGILSITKNGEERWRLTTCTAPNATRPLGNVVASPTIGPNDEDILVGTEGTDGTNGGIFRIVEDNAGVPQCRWGFPSNGVAFATRSSPPVIADPNDFALLTLFVGNSNGRLIALSADGARRWSFPADVPLSGNVSSSPAFSTLGIVISAPDGRVYTVDETGRQLWAFRIGEPAGNEPVIQPSVATQDGVFAVNRRSLYSLNIDGSEKWHYEAPDEILGSPASSFLTIPRDNGQLVQETVVFAVDRSGTLVAIVNSTGEPVRLCSTENDTCSPSSCPGETPCLDVRRCSDSEDLVCDEDGDCPDGEDCESTDRCAIDDSIECTEDTCLDDDNAGHCTRRAVLPLSRSAEISVESSPVISLDTFVVVATTDGRVCARGVDGSVPGGQCEQSGSNCTPDSCGEGDQCCGEDDPECPVPGRCRNEPSLGCSMDSCSTGDVCNSPWRDGCIPLAAELGTTTRSSPVVDEDGRIYVTTEQALVRIE